MSEKILVPVLGESITEATVSKWLKNKGETVDADEPIVELETDKVNLEVPSPVTGKLIEINSSDGSTVNIGGFPFTGNNAHGSCLFTLGQYIDVMPDSTIDLFTNVRFNGNSVLLHEGRNNQDITYTQLNSSGNLQFACSYAL